MSCVIGVITDGDIITLTQKKIDTNFMEGSEKVFLGKMIFLNFETFD